MRRLGLYNLLFTMMFLLSAFSTIIAQNGEPPPNGQGFAPPPRPNLLQELGLTKAQIQQMRRMNSDLQPRMREAQRNLREANQALDEAIYADETSEEIIKERIRAAQQAQAEVLKNRVLMETSVRRILTREQLVKFREMRQQFAQKQANPNNPNKNPNKVVNQKRRPLQNRIGRPNQ